MNECGAPKRSWNMRLKNLASWMQIREASKVQQKRFADAVKKQWPRYPQCPALSFWLNDLTTTEDALLCSKATMLGASHPFYRSHSSSAGCDGMVWPTYRTLCTSATTRCNVHRLFRGARVKKSDATFKSNASPLLSNHYYSQPLALLQ